MELPPGPRYVIRIVFQALPTSLAAYAILRLVGYLGVVTPVWSPLVVLLLAPPAVNFVMEYWRAYQDRVDAAAHGAMFVPRVSEGSAAITEKLVKNMHSGYPSACFIVKREMSGVPTRYVGDVYLPWREQYGETFALMTPPEPRVCVCHPDFTLCSIITMKVVTFEPEHVKVIYWPI
jgi:hypothetical protein